MRTGAHRCRRCAPVRIQGFGGGSLPGGSPEAGGEHGVFFFGHLAVHIGAETIKVACEKKLGTDAVESEK